MEGLVLIKELLYKLGGRSGAEEPYVMEEEEKFVGGLWSCWLCFSARLSSRV